MYGIPSQNPIQSKQLQFSLAIAYSSEVVASGLAGLSPMMRRAASAAGARID